MKYILILIAAILVGGLIGGIANTNTAYSSVAPSVIKECEDTFLSGIEKQHCYAVLSDHYDEWAPQIKTGDSPY